MRGRDDLVATRVMLANQLRALLESFWPGAALIFAAIDSPIALAFLARFPTPQSAAHLGEKRLAAFLARQATAAGGRWRSCSRACTRRPSDTPRGRSRRQGDLVQAFVGVLTPLVAQLQRLTAAVEHAVATHPDGAVVMTFPRAGRINAAQILAELGDDRARFATEAQLAAEAGVAPVTYASGKHRGVGFRWACNKRLRQAITCFADNSRHSSPWATAVYQRARARGCDHPHAVRILARAWVRVLWRCWYTATPYDPTRHGGRAACSTPHDDLKVDTGCLIGSPSRRKCRPLQDVALLAEDLVLPPQPPQLLALLGR